MKDACWIKLSAGVKRYFIFKDKNKTTKTHCCKVGAFHQGLEFEDLSYKTYIRLCTCALPVHIRLSIIEAFVCMSLHEFELRHICRHTEGERRKYL